MKIIEGYCPEGFEKNFGWQTKKNEAGETVAFFLAYLTKDTPLKDRTGFIKMRITVEKITSKGKA